MPARPRYTTPGPGSYDINRASKIRFEKGRVSSFSNTLCQYNREKTGPLANKASTPSPDEYSVHAASLKTKFNPGSTRFGSEERKGPTHNLSKNPGPGQYGSTNYDKISNGSSLSGGKGRSEAPKFSFGGQNIRQKVPRTSSTPNNVGPSSYKSNPSIGRQVVSVRPSSPTWGLGKASRAQVQSVVSPGYQPMYNKDSIANPGVGLYEPNGSSYDIGKKSILSTSSSSPSFGQGTSIRPDLSVKSNNPGPGYYRVPSSIKSQAESMKPTTPSWSFGTSQRPSLDDGMVG